MYQRATEPSSGEKIQMHDDSALAGKSTGNTQNPLFQDNYYVTVLCKSKRPNYLNWVLDKLISKFSNPIKYL